LRIEAVHLENIRSHARSVVPLSRGFNCLVGGLGTGKSSILYAIDFVLFGDPLGRSYGYLLREGAGAGRVGIRFVQGGKTYTLWRALRRKERGIGQDMEELKLLEGDTTIASAKSEAVAEQLKAITGLDRDLFHEVVWVRQEHLKELLDVAPRDRQKRLDELFGLSDFEAAWGALAGVQRDYRVEKEVYERDPDVTGLEGLQAEYDKAVIELTSVQEELAGLQKELTEAEAGLKEADGRLRSLEDLRRQTEELKRREVRLQTEVVSLEDACARLAEEIQRRTMLIEDIEGRLRSLEAQEKTHRGALGEAGLRPDVTVEELRGHLAALEEQVTSLGGEREATLKEMATAQRRASSLTAENKCPLCLQPLPGDYKESLLGQLQRENTEREGRLAELQKNAEELRRLRDLVGRAASELQLLAPRMAEFASRVKEERASLDAQSKEFEEKEQRERTLRAQLDGVRAEITKFDVAELESARRLRDEAFERHSRARHRVEMLEGRRRDLGLRMDGLGKRLDTARQKVERVGRVGRIMEAVEGVRGAYRSIQPRLRADFVNYLERAVQQVLDGLAGEEAPALTAKIDETYTPVLRGEEGYDRDAQNLSGGERTLLAFAYRIGLGQLILQSRTGHSLQLLLLDEPTESLGPEDGSVDRLAEAVSRLKAIEQIVAVTHSEAFAEKADHVIRVGREAGASRVTAER